MATARIELPPKLVPVFTPARGEVRYRAAYGGRGSGKSFSFALMAAIFGYAEPLRILATRELQVSIKESFHAEVKNAILSTPWLEAHYDVGVDYIKGKNGTEFIFRGLRHNISGIKSMARVDLCIVEEAEEVPAHSWVDLEPTIRAPKSEIWVIWNPKREGSPVDRLFRKGEVEGAEIAQLNYMDNPWFPDVLEQARTRDRRVMDGSTYAHVWDGAYLVNSDSQILKGKWTVEEFEPKHNWDGPYIGLDFGFAADPTACVKMWVHGEVLYVEHEAGARGLELDSTAQFLTAKIPEIEQHAIIADNARPESISYLSRHGLPRMRSCQKGKGSIEDGISHLRQYAQIIIHPRCKEVINEANLYSYKVDRLSGDILPVISDDNNHYIDAMRYGLEPIMKNNHFTNYAGIL